MGTCGYPTANGKKGGVGKGKRVANLLKFIQEYHTERYSSDPDIDRSIENFYFGGFKNGQEVYDYILNLAKNHEVLGKNGKPRKMREDATLALCVISKPDEKMFREIEEMAEERDVDYNELEQKFLSDLYDCNEQIFKKHGFQILAGALHLDEQNPHYHYTLIDPDFKISKKATLPFFTDLNSTIPKMMRERGWPMEDLTVYDRDRAEKEPEYKAKHIKAKKEKKHNRSSAEYKADKEHEKKVKEMQAQQQREIGAREFLRKKLEAANARAESLEDVAEERDFYKAKAEATSQENEMLRELLRAEKRKPAEVVEVEKVVESPELLQENERQSEVIEAQKTEINRLNRKIEALKTIRELKGESESTEDVEKVLDVE